MRTTAVVFLTILGVAAGICIGIAATFKWLDKEAKKLTKPV